MKKLNSILESNQSNTTREENQKIQYIRGKYYYIGKTGDKTVEFYAAEYLDKYDEGRKSEHIRHIGRKYCYLRKTSDETTEFYTVEYLDRYDERRKSEGLRHQYKVLLNTENT